MRMKNKFRIEIGKLADHEKVVRRAFMFISMVLQWFGL